MNYKPSRLNLSLKLLSIASLSCHVFAGAFSLYTEGSASAVGNYAAGIAAEGRDASVGWYNPAALVLLRKPEVLAGFVGVLPTVSLSGTATFYQIDPSYGDLLAPYQQNFSNVNGGREAIVPNLHIALPIGDKVTYGLSLLVPYGLSSDWPEDSALRYAGTYSSLRVINLSPEMGGLITDNLALGAGIDLQWADVNFDNVLGSPAALQFAGANPTALDSPLQNHGDSFGFGFHAGFLMKWHQDKTRFGFNYAYGATHQFEDSSSITGLLADPNFADKNATFISNLLKSNDIKFPDVMTFSLFQQVNDKVAIMGSVVYSLWSSFDKIILQNIGVYQVETDSLGYASGVTVQNYQNALRASVGINYQLNDEWELRTGGGYDQTPTNPVDRDTRLPDVDKLAIAAGAHWNYNQHWGFDAGYSYLFPLSDPKINKTQILDNYNYLNVVATGHAYAQLFAAQLVWKGD
ncbi:MAG: transporter [Gammaproteobacteria bacterium]|nr:transporter [Gammaproteobacteria bacterium]